MTFKNFVLWSKQHKVIGAMCFEDFLDMTFFIKSVERLPYLRRKRYWHKTKKQIFEQFVLPIDNRIKGEKHNEHTRQT